MKVLVVNTSSNGTVSELEMLLNPFVKGITESGADVESVNTCQMNINPCRACTDDVSFEPKGKCDCQDDMQLLYPKFRESDIWVFAAPFLSKKVPPVLFNILDRLEPLFESASVMNYQKKNESNGKIVFLSTSSSFSSECFSSFVDEFKNISRLYSKEYAGSLLRPHSWAIISLRELGVNVEDIFDAAYEAGRQLITNGKISPTTSKLFGRQLIPDDISLP